MNLSSADYEGPRGTKPEEADKLMELVDSVFASNWPVRMRGRFPVLFSNENLENCRIIVHDGKPVSHVGYLVRDAVIAGPTIRIASIGAVCTHPDYRKQHLASRLLDDCERRMREQGVDVIYICTPTNLHSDMVKAAADAGKPIMCEKPLAHSCPQARELVAITQSSEVNTSVGLVLRYDPFLLHAHALLARLFSNSHLIE